MQVQLTAHEIVGLRAEVGYEVSVERSACSNVFKKELFKGNGRACMSHASEGANRITSCSDSDRRSVQRGQTRFEVQALTKGGWQGPQRMMFCCLLVPKLLIQDRLEHSGFHPDAPDRLRARAACETRTWKSIFQHAEEQP